MISTTECSIDVDVGVRTAYNQWTQFELFPHFMEDVEEVRQLDDTTLEWKVKVGGVTRRWTAEITEQIPDKRIAWSTVDGPLHGGVVTFHELDDLTTRVMYQMDFEPASVLERAAARSGLVDHRVKADLERFKSFVETVGHETGAWRGTIER